MTSSLRCPFSKSTHGTRWSRAKGCIEPTNASVIVSINADEANGDPQCPTKNPAARPRTATGRINIQIHPVDALDLEHHMISEDIGDGSS